MCRGGMNVCKIWEVRGVFGSESPIFVKNEVLWERR